MPRREPRSRARPRCSSSHGPGWVTSRCGSLASSGMPDAVKEPETTQSFEPGRARSARRHEQLGALRGRAAHPARRAGARTPSCSRATTRGARTRGGVRQRVVGDIGREVEQRVFDWRRRRGVDPRPDAPHGTGRGCALILVSHRLRRWRGGRPVQPDRPDEPVVSRSCARRRPRRQAAGRGAARARPGRAVRRRSRRTCATPQVVEGLGIDRGTPNGSRRMRQTGRSRPLSWSVPSVEEERWARHLAKLVRHAREGIATRGADVRVDSCDVARGRSDRPRR